MTVATPLTEVLDRFQALPVDERMPTMFIGHGTPMNALEDNTWTEQWREVGGKLPRPRAIISVSAHWLTQGGVLITANDAPRMNYDMYGFPDELYQLVYPAPGNVSIASEIAEAMPKEVPCFGDNRWGFDHGTWVVLKHMFPDADIPVIQLSIDYSRPPAFHFDLARKLSSLRDKGLLIIGSGNLVHNIRLRDGKPYDWAIEFDQKIADFIDRRDFESVVDFQQLGRIADLSHPTYDHFLPLLYTLGLARPDELITSFCEGWQMPAASMRSFLVSAA
ncbi:MAG: 4,5-DOPA dioxygenase extradiol [Gammaproteobacteria bacterium]|nr:4,5-DOPA dioxygenase extradiol [Gammaproteobacteria bacterium]